MAEGTDHIQVALAGNPNCGKTSIFNNMTGARQHVGNYAGVTVEEKIGHTNFEGKKIEIIDLPGTYSLTARSIDELVARNVIIHDHPEMIVNVVDASNLERNLYLTAQLIELERPILLALNMIDVATEMGLKINNERLAKLTGSTVVETIGRTNKGTQGILKGIVDVAAAKKAPGITIPYGDDIEPAIAELQKVVEVKNTSEFPNRFLAVKLLEDDEDVVNTVKGMNPEAIQKATELRAALADKVDLDIVFQEYRHRFAVDVFNQSLDQGYQQRESRSDKIDKILTNRILGLPIFLIVMWVLFNLVINIGAYPQGWIETGMGYLTDFLNASMPDGLLRSLIVDGVIGGVGAVLSFIPLIVLLFVGISFLEDSGYMARAAFVVDRVMRAFGLHGKSFIPMLLGFGCSVPAIMGARILDNPRDRMVTILVSPFMSCGARLPVYTLLAAAFFPPEQAGTILFGIYLLGVIVAIIVAKILRQFVFTGDTEPFAMEMPPYHMPTLKSVLIHMWERSVLYLKKAGTFILAASIIVWLITTFPQNDELSGAYDQLKEATDNAYSQEIDNYLASQNINDDQKDAIDKLVEQMGALDEQHADDEADDEEQPADDQQTEEERQQEAQDAQNAVEADMKSAEDVMNGASAEDIANEDVKAAVEDQLKAEPAEVPEYMNELKADKLFPVAWQVYQLNKANEDRDGAYDFANSSAQIQGSYASMFGHFIEPIMAPLGFNWKINVAVVAAIAAKEVMVSTLGTIYSVEAGADDTATLQEMLAHDPSFTPAIALGLMVFSLLYLPCLAAMAVLKRETGSWKWLGIVFLYTNGLAWFGALIAVHVARAFGIN